MEYIYNEICAVSRILSETIVYTGTVYMLCLLIANSKYENVSFYLLVELCQINNISHSRCVSIYVLLVINTIDSL